MTRIAFTLGLAVAVALGLTWLAVLIVAGWRVALRWHPQEVTPWPASTS